MRRAFALIAAVVFGASVRPSSAPAQAGDTLRLSLAEALSRGGERHPLVLQARADRRARSADVLAGNAAFLPRVSAELDLVRSDDPVFAFGSRLRQGAFAEPDFALDALNRPAPLTDAATRFTLEQPIFRPEELLARRAGIAAARAAGFAEQRAGDAASFDIVTGYFRVGLAAERVRVLGEALDVARRVEAQVDALRRSGTVTVVDGQLARARVAELTAAVANAEAGRLAAADLLLLLLGEPAGRAVVVTDTLAAPGAEPDSAPRAERADLAAFTEALAAADAGVSAARASWAPNAGAFGTLEWHDGRFRPAAGPERWTLGLVIRWTPLKGLADIGRLRRAEAERDGLRARVADARRRADAEVRAARADRTAALQSLEAANRALEGSAEAARVAEVRYREGLSTLSELLAVRAAQSAQRLARLDALYQARVAGAALRMAEGRTPR
jgi:outer membrane protein TolC